MIKQAQAVLKVEAQESETFFGRGKAALLLVDHQAKLLELCLKSVPCFPCLFRRPGQQDHVVGVSHQSYPTQRIALGVTPLPIHFVQYDIRKHG